MYCTYVYDISARSGSETLRQLLLFLSLALFQMLGFGMTDTWPRPV